MSALEQLAQAEAVCLTAREDNLLKELAERVAYGLRQNAGWYVNATAVRDAFDELLDEAIV